LVVSLNWFTRTQADFSSGDRNDATPPISKRLEHPDLVSVWRQSGLHLGRFPRNRTGDLAAMEGNSPLSGRTSRREGA
jgi:hypothetical protein